MEYLTHLLVLAGLYGILSLSLDLLTGHTGMVSLAHIGFFGIGAYSSALAATDLHMPFLLGVLVGMGAAAIVAIVFARVSLRLHDDYFVIATLGFHMLLASIFTNLAELTRGPLGIRAIPRPILLGWTIQTPYGFLVLTSGLLAITLLVTAQVDSSPFGRSLHAIRDDEVFAASLGKNVVRYKSKIFVLAAVLAAVSGSLFAHYVTYIDPGNFTVGESVLVISMVIVGGPSSLWGPLIGAVLLVFLPESLRFLGLGGTAAASVRQLLYGGLLLLILLVRPKGIIGRYDFSQ